MFENQKTISNSEGQLSYIKQGNVARIWDVRATKPKTGFFTSALLQLQKDGIKTIVITLQSSDMRKALSNLVKSGILLNARNIVGSSTDEHPSTFDIKETKIRQDKINNYFTGVVDNNDSVRAFEHGPDKAGSSHQNIGFGNSTGRWRYIPKFNRVDWTDTPTSDKIDAVDNFLSKKGINPDKHVAYIGSEIYRDKQSKMEECLINEGLSIDSVVQFYKSRFSEMSFERGIEFFVTNENNNLYISCGIVHMDMILNSAKMLDDEHFIIPNSKKKKTYKTDVDISDFIPDVEDALKKANINPTTIHIISTKNHTLNTTFDNRRVKISIEVYMDDMITVTLQIKNASILLNTQSNQIIKLIDSFINQMIKTQKVLYNTTFKPDDNEQLTEQYTDGMSDEEHDALEMSYFSIGQEHDEDVSNSFCWIWNKFTQSIEFKKGGTHADNFGVNARDFTFRGWYDPNKNAISVVFPDSESRKLGNKRPTEDDIPQRIYNSLMRTFGKEKPKFVVFEELKPDLKKMVVEMVKDILMEDKRIYGWWIDSNGKAEPVEYQDHSYWAMEYLKNRNEPNPEKNTYKKMYALGFIRAIKEEYNGWGIYYEYSIGKPPTSKQIKEMKDLAIENNCKYIYDDVLKKWSSVGEEGFMNENMTYKELLDLTTPERKERSANVRVRSIPVSVENGQQQWRFRYKSSPTTTVTNKPFEGHITFFKEDIGSNENAMDLDCKVDCGCPDYMYKFAYNNMKQDAGDIGKDSLNKCANRSPQPAYDIGEGLCKHLAALRGYLQTKITATKKSNLFEAMNDVANQGPFEIQCED